MTSRATATKTQPTPREEEILAAAARIFREKGYHGASVRDIAESVGLLKGSLYHYIRSKEELLARLFEGALEDTIQELEKIAARDAAPPVRLREMVKAYVGAVTENLDAVSLYLREWRALPAPQLARVRARRRTMRTLFEDVIADGVRAGELPATRPASRGRPCRRARRTRATQRQLRRADEVDRTGTRCRDELRPHCPARRVDALDSFGREREEGRPVA